MRKQGTRLKSLKRRTIGVLMGGGSSEREVSLRSGTAIYKTLKSARYNAAAIDAGKDLCEVLKKKRIDLAFIALHGGHGENGAVQGMLEIMGIPYTGSGILASALAMDKEASKKAFLYNEVPVPPFRIIKSEDRGVKKVATPHARKAAVASSLFAPYSSASFRLPWVVKPAAEGSSVGVEIVRKSAEFPKSLAKAFSYGDRVVIEKYIEGKEVQIGILNDRVLGGVEVRPSLEFYNYEAKYTSGLTEYIFPPQLDRKTYRKVEEAALTAHRALGCSGATRVDLIVDSSSNPYVLEVNTIPGMTETSLLPKIAADAGIDFLSLLEEILGGALA
jgi:D-alanine-D-alanine ligase